MTVKIKKLFFAFALALLLISGLPANNAAASETSQSYENTLSEFIYNMLLFVKWPDNAFTSDDSPIRITIMGKEGFSEILKKRIGKRKIGKRQLIIEKSDDIDQITPGHVLFIGKEMAGDIDHILDSVYTKPVLTMGDSDGFAKKGVILNYYTDRKRIKQKDMTALLERFDAPVVVTVNPSKMTDKSFHKLDPIPRNLMFVRFRINTWNTGLAARAIDYYTALKVPVILTLMIDVPA